MEDKLLSSPNEEQLQKLLPGLPQSYTFDEIVQRLATASAGSASQESHRSTVLATFASLAHPERISCLDPAAESHSVQQLTNLLAAGLRLPPPTRVTDNAVQALVAEAGLACLQRLFTKWSCCLDNSALLSLVHYTDASDPWTTGGAAVLASALLERCLPGTALVDFIAGPLLQTSLRPIFSKSSARVTATGRPSHFRIPGDSPSSAHPMEPPSWKKVGLQVVSDFHWAVRASDADTLSRYWPLFTPVLLALAEDQETSIRVRGLEILGIFLDKCPGQILQSTGIATVFQEAVFPTLLHLPSLTPEPDSVKLLDPAYRALLAIAKMDADQGNLRRRRLLDKLLRDGVLAGYHHSSQHIRIVRVLMHHTEAIVGCLGIFTVKHLVALLPLFASVMTDPFAVAYPPAVLAASKALNATLATCWPRISDTEHASQVMHIIIICRLNLHDSVGASPVARPEFDAIAKELALSATFLESLWAKGNLEPPSRWAEVLQRKPELAELFPALQDRLVADAS